MADPAPKPPPDLLESLRSLTWAQAWPVLLVPAIGLPLVLLLRWLVLRPVRKRLSPQSYSLLSRGILYGGLSLVLVLTLNQMGYHLGALLGAAGIAGIAIGLAAQGSLANAIGGFFLVAEKPFAIGDVIQVDGFTGVIESIDLLSLKLRTFDNRLVRIPNENLIKSSVVNITRYPIRRMDVTLGVAYKEDVARVREVLAAVADTNPLVLDEPKPLILFTGFGDSALEFLFGVWFKRENFLDVRNSVMQAIKERFDAEGIEIPFPHRTLYAGSATAPFPVRVVGGSLPDEAGARGD